MSIRNTFTIHGLYPYTEKGAQMLYCDGTEFDVNSVSSQSAFNLLLKILALLSIKYDFFVVTFIYIFKSWMFV